MLLDSRGDNRAWIDNETLENSGGMEQTCDWLLVATFAKWRWLNVDQEKEKEDLIGKKDRKDTNVQGDPEKISETIRE